MVLIASAAMALVLWEPVPLRNEAERRAGRWGGEGGARIQAIAISPDGRCTLAGTEGSGIWRSEDGGATWRPARRGLGASDIKDIRFDPRAPRIAFALAGAHDPLGSRFGRAEGIYRSSDGGRSWTLLRRTDFGPGSFGARIVFDPRSSPAAGEPCRAILVSTMREGILRTDDGGASWSRVPIAGGDAFTLAAAGVGERLDVFAGTSAGVFASSDGGNRFHRIGQELPILEFEAPLGPTLAATGAADASEPGPLRLYAACREHGIFRSLDGGASWTPANGERGGRLPLGADQDWVSVVASPADPLVAFANPARASRGVERSPLWTHDGGASWHPPASIDGSMRLFPIEAEIGEAIACDPEDPMRVLAGIGGRLFLSTDGGKSWTDRNDGIRGPGSAARASIAFGPAGAGIFRIAIDRLGVVETTDGGETFRSIAGEGPPAEDAAEGLRRIRGAGADPKTIYAEVRDRTGWALEVSRDGGATWSRLGPLLDDPIATLAPDPRRAERVYVGTDRGLVIIEGETARRIEIPELADDVPAVRAIAIDPAAPEVVYAGRWSPAGLADGIFASTDAGGTWRRLGEGIEPGLNVLAIGVDPRDGTVYAATDCGLWRLRGGLRAAREGGSP